MNIKAILFSTLFALSTVFTYSQVISDSVTLGSSYANQVFYKLSDGTKTVSNNQNWDLQFFSSLFSASIRVNNGVGVELYEAVSTDTSNFASTTLDTSSLTLMRDGYMTWENDAFTSQQTGHPNYGWGVYQGLGNIVGNKIYAIKLSGGAIKKIWIRNFKTSGTLTFSIANLNGTGIVTKTINRGSYSTKRHFYYDVEADSVIDCEPIKNQWELVFRTYNDIAGPSTYYNVTGALTNYDLGVAQVNNTATGTAKSNFQTYPLDSAINVIGFDWKSFNMMTFTWDITDSLSYIMPDNNGDVYQLIFTGTSGGSTGKMYFTKEKIAFASVEENSAVSSLGVFPNPTTGVLNVNFELSNSSIESNFRLVDLNGKTVKNLLSNYASKGFQRTSFDISDLNTGVYFLIVTSGEFITTKKIIKQ